MSLHTIQYKGLDIAIQLEEGKDKRNFSFTKNHILHKILVFDPVSDSQSKTIDVNYVEQKFDSEGTLLSSRQFRVGFGAEEYIKWATYNLDNVVGSWLDLYFRPTINTSLANYFGEPNLYCFNPLNNFNPFKPVIFDTTVTETSITVNVEEQGVGNLIYSINEGVSWQGTNVFEGLTAGTEYNVWCATDVDLFPCRRVVRTLDVE